MDNQTIKNMELILLEIRKNVMTKGSDTRASKTLIHSYLTLLKSFERMKGTEITQEIQSKLGVQADQLHIIRNYIKEDKMQELFNLSDYVGINNYATVLDKIEQALQSIGKPKRSLYTPLTLIEELLEKSIQTGTLVTFFDKTHRGMGKTTALVKKAHELDAILLVGSDIHAKCARDIRDNMELHTSVATLRDMVLHQNKVKIKEKGYLIDETFQIDHLNKLKGYKILGGFTRIII